MPLKPKSKTLATIEMEYLEPGVVFIYKLKKFILGFSVICQKQSILLFFTVLPILWVS